MKIKSIVEACVILVVVALLINVFRSYIPQPLQFLVKIFDVVYNTAVSIVLLIIDAVVAILEILKGLFPR